jgi:hypothetical protein
MEDLIVDKELDVDPGTQTTSTQSIGMSKEDWEKLDRRERSMI